ncbi:MAG: hypothetical protein ACT4OO_13635 [Nitrospiraceae bacterium]
MCWVGAAADSLVAQPLPPPKPPSSPTTLQNDLLEGERLSREGDAFAKEGREMQAANRYLAAQVRFQQIILDLYELTLRSSFGGPVYDEDLLMGFGGRVAELRNVNVSKLWLVLDPEDRAFEKGLEDQRAAFVSAFADAATPDAIVRLEKFLQTLYPDDPEGERQMESLRTGRLPASKRWARLKYSDRLD